MKATATAVLPERMAFVQRDWLSCNQVLLFDDDDTATLIDSGYVKHVPRTLALLRDALRGRRLRRLINTHLHSDHCGGNAAVQQVFGCAILVPQAELDAVARWDPDRLTFDATGQRCPRFSADGGIAAGERLALGGSQWDVHAAPGHDPHSLILHDPAQRLLMSADALWRHGFGVIFPELSGESGFAEQQAVLALIASLPVDRVIPGHGAVFDEVDDALRTATSRLVAMREDPARHARSAIKVLVKFLLLDRESMPLADLEPLARSARVLIDAAGVAGLDSLAALRNGVDELARMGLVRVADGWVHDVPDPAAEGH